MARSFALRGGGHELPVRYLCKRRELLSAGPGRQPCVMHSA